jgi:hypothetical protein
MESNLASEDWWLSLEHEVAVLVVAEVALLAWGTYVTITVEWIGGYLLVLAWMIGIIESGDSGPAS